MSKILKLDVTTITLLEKAYKDDVLVKSEITKSIKVCLSI